MSDKLKGAKRAPITYYSNGATGKVVVRWVEPPEGYGEAGVITMYPGAILKGGYQDYFEERKILKGEVIYVNYKGTTKCTPESDMLCVERAAISTCYNNSNEEVEIYFQIKKTYNKK